MMPSQSSSSSSAHPKHPPHPANSVSGAATSSSSSSTSSSSKIEVTFDPLTFDDVQRNRLRQLERRIEAETKRKGRQWKREIERMRQEFIELEPVIAAAADDVTVSRDAADDDVIVDPTRMKTTFLDYPDTGRRFKVRFDLTGYDRRSIAVGADRRRIEVRASRTVETESGGGEGSEEKREYVRTVEKPPEVNHAKLKSYLTSDDILIVEAPLAPSSLDLGHVIHRCHSAGLGRYGQHHRQPSSSLSTSCHSSSQSNNSPGTPSGNSSSSSAAGAGAAGAGGIKDKYGVPIFRDEDGRRVMHLIVDVGAAFRADDVVVQVIKENRILVKAKRETRSEELRSKHKFCREFELSEKIETQSLRGGFQNDGTLIVSAMVKLSKKKSLLLRANSSSSASAAEEIRQSGKQH